MQASESRVIVGVSDGLGGLEALRVAVDEARRRHAPLVAIRSWVLTMPWNEAELRGWRTEIARDAAAFVQRAFDEAMGGFPRDIPVRIEAVEGMADQTLVAAANRRGDVLVVGAGGRGRWRIRWPRVAQYCVRHATCPVIVVPPPEMASTTRRGMIRTLHREFDDFVQASGDHTD